MIRVELALRWEDTETLFYQTENVLQNVKFKKHKI